MKGLVLVAAAALVLTLSPLAPPAAAGHSFVSKGVAIQGGIPFKLQVGGHIDQLKPEESIYHIIISDWVFGNQVEFRVLRAVSNWVNLDNLPPDTLVVNPHFHAEDIDPDITLVLDGVQASQVAIGDGSYVGTTGAYELHYSPDFTGLL